MNKGHSVLGVVTGKPLSVGGSLGREEATARGSLYCVAGAVGRSKAERLDDYSVAVQGFGNVGCEPRAAPRRDGAKVVAVSDSRGGVYNPNGIDVPAALAHKQETRHARRARERGADHERGAARASRATCSRRARSSR